MGKGDKFRKNTNLVDICPKIRREQNGWQTDSDRLQSLEHYDIYSNVTQIRGVNRITNSPSTHERFAPAYKCEENKLILCYESHWILRGFNSCVIGRTYHGLLCNRTLLLIFIFIHSVDQRVKCKKISNANQDLIQASVTRHVSGSQNEPQKNSSNY